MNKCVLDLISFILYLYNVFNFLCAHFAQRIRMFCKDIIMYELEKIFNNKPKKNNSYCILCTFLRMLKTSKNL